MKYLTETETAEILGLQPATLKVARSTRTGDIATLPFAKFGRSIRYAEDEVRNWAAERRVATK